VKNGLERHFVAPYNEGENHSESDQPLDEEPFMNPQQIERFRRRLLIWRGQLFDETDGGARHPYKISEAQFDAMRSVANLTDQSIHDQSSDRRMKLLGKIDTALNRIDAGAYGIEQGFMN
jgi:DnaK suppressor protein